MPIIPVYSFQWISEFFRLDLLNFGSPFGLNAQAFTKLEIAFTIWWL